MLVLLLRKLGKAPGTLHKSVSLGRDLCYLFVLLGLRKTRLWERSLVSVVALNLYIEEILMFRCLDNIASYRETFKPTEAL